MREKWWGIQSLRWSSSVQCVRKRGAGAERGRQRRREREGEREKKDRRKREIRVCKKPRVGARTD
jgi:hypothetical protein